MDKIAEPLTDKSLLKQFVASKDRDALETLVRRHSAMVFSVCSGLLHQQQDAEDAFQAVFVLLAVKAKKLQGHDSIGGWLHETSTRTCLGLRRRLARNKEVAMTQPVCGNHNEPWQTITAAREFEVLHGEIDQLPQRYREAIVLFHLEGKSRTQVASTLGCSIGSVKALLERARKMLRHRLLRQGVAASSTVFATAFSVGNTQSAAAGVLSGAMVNELVAPDSTLIELTVDQCLRPSPLSTVENTILQSVVQKESAMAIGTVKGGSLSVAAALTGLLVSSVVVMGALGDGSGGDASDELKPIVNSPVVQQSTNQQDSDLLIETAAPQKKDSDDSDDEPSFERKYELLKQKMAEMKKSLGKNHPSVKAAEKYLKELEAKQQPKYRIQNGAIQYETLKHNGMFVIAPIRSRRTVRSTNSKTPQTYTVQVPVTTDDGRLEYRTETRKRVEVQRTIPFYGERSLGNEDATFFTVGGKSLTLADLMEKYSKDEEFIVVKVVGSAKTKVPAVYKQLLKNDVIIMIQKTPDPKGGELFGK